MAVTSLTDFWSTINTVVSSLRGQNLSYYPSIQEQTPSKTTPNPHKDIRISLKVSKKMSLQVPTMQTIFDALPTEVNVRIVRCFLRSPDRYRRALAFANGSEQRRREVIEAFSNKIYAIPENMEILPELIAFFGNDLYEFSAIYASPVYANIPPIPHLRTASIRGTKQHLRIIKGASSLTKLHVKLQYGTCWNALITTMSSLSLLYLSINGMYDPPPPVELHERFSQACSNVTELDLDIYDGQYEPYWPLILRLKRLKRISLIGLLTLEDEHLMFLQGLENVELLCSPKALQQAVSIGHQVTEIRQTVCVPEENFVQLSRCPSLKCIRISLEEGAERALIGKIDNVVEMELRWGDRVTRGANDTEPTYYEPDGRLLLELVNRAPNLRSVRFQSVVVRTKHIRRILKSLGPRLVDFVVNANNQGEGESWRITKVLKSLATWCPNIEFVKFLTWTFPITATEDEVYESEIVAGSVRRKCPHLNIQDIVGLCPPFTSS